MKETLAGTVRWESLGGREILLYLPPGYTQSPQRPYPVLYLLNAKHQATLFPQALPPIEAGFADGSLPPAILAGVPTEDHDGDYTPWPAVGFDGVENAFPGRGDAYLHWLAGVLKPAVDAAYPTDPGFAATGLEGVSLGGLIATYSAFVTPVFGRIISVSGSFWYPDWAAFLERTPLPNPDTRFLLTCGRYEGKGFFTMGKDAGECTQETQLLLQKSLAHPAQAEYRPDNGKHHDKQVSRLRTALTWFLAG